MGLWNHQIEQIRVCWRSKQQQFNWKFFLFSFSKENQLSPNQAITPKSHPQQQFNDFSFARRNFLWKVENQFKSRSHANHTHKETTFFFSVNKGKVFVIIRKGSLAFWYYSVTKSCDKEPNFFFFSILDCPFPLFLLSNVTNESLDAVMGLTRENSGIPWWGPPIENWSHLKSMLYLSMGCLTILL